LLRSPAVRCAVGGRTGLVVEQTQTGGTRDPVFTARLHRLDISLLARSIVESCLCL
jgi:hypothetical protein